MKLAYADPPYPGQSAKHYSEHPDFAGEVDHEALVHKLKTYDGWVLHTSSTTLPEVLWYVALANLGTIDLRYQMAELGDCGIRLMAWVKPFAAFKRNVSVAYAWEPVIVKAARKPVVKKGLVYRDWLAESITLKKGLTGAKPEKVCKWLFEMLGAQREDEFEDLFPGSGAVSRAWDSWRMSDMPASRPPKELWRPEP